MTRRSRNIIFGILFISFLIIAPLTVFYSLGWRFDWETKKIVQTGIFYFKTWPKGSQVYINGELRDKTDIFFGSALIDNLMPGEYRIEIMRDGYHSWGKTLEIKRREVSEANNIVLIPKDPNFNVLVENVEDFFLSSDNNTVITKEKNDGYWSLKLYELKNGVKSHIVDETNFSTKGVELFDLQFSDDSKRILLKLGLKEEIQYYSLEIDKSPVVINKLDFLNSPEKIYFHPKSNQKLFISQIIEEKKRITTVLNEIDIVNKEISPPIFKDIIAYLITNDNIYHLNSSGLLLKSDLSGDRIETLNVIAFPYKEEINYEIITSYSNIFLRENNELYYFDEDAKSFKKFSDSIKDYKFSPDNKKLVYYNDSEIVVLFLEKQYDQPTKEKGEKLSITRFSENINNVFWYTNHHLIFGLEDKIKVTELDDRDKINITDLVSFKHDKIFFSNKKLYILSEKTLYSSDGLTP